MPIQRKNIILWVFRLLAAVIMLQTLFFKFTAAEESVYIFSTLGIEPGGRVGTGVVELIASALILWPRTTAFGALLAVGAIISHLTVLGLVVKDDGGQLFIYALLVFISSAILAYVYRQQLIDVFKLVAGTSRKTSSLQRV